MYGIQQQFHYNSSNIGTYKQYLKVTIKKKINALKETL